MEPDSPEWLRKGFLSEAHWKNSTAVQRGISSQPKRSPEEAIAQYHRMHSKAPPAPPPPPGWEETVPAEQLERAKALLPRGSDISPAELVWFAMQPASGVVENRRHWIRGYIQRGWDFECSTMAANYLANCEGNGLPDRFLYRYILPGPK